MDMPEDGAPASASSTLSDGSPSLADLMQQLVTALQAYNSANSTPSSTATVSAASTTTSVAA
jgi:K+-transporting ATPase c subunit